MCSLFDGQDILDEVDPAFSENIRRHVDRVVRLDPFHVSANTDPKGDRSKRPQEQDPDMLLHIVKETDAGIVVRGGKFETAAAYANQAFTKPTIANWGDEEFSDYAIGFHLRPRLTEPEVHLARPVLPVVPLSRITRSPTASTRSTRSSFSMTC
jgi:4-hydroxyphenylacetate 3-monooxygenase